MLHPHPLSYHKGSLPYWDCPNQGKDSFWIVLPVGIDGNGPVSYPESCSKPCKQRSSFTLILHMAYHCYARKGSEDIGSGVCRSIIHHNHRQPELEAFLNDPPYLWPMVISGNENGIAKRFGHEMRNPGSTVPRPRLIIITRLKK
jgi:hypothetical protein